MEHPLASHNSHMPPGWSVEPLADGSLRFMQTDAARRATSGAYVPFAIIWNVMVLFMIGVSYGLVPGKWEVESFSAIPGVSPLFLFALFGFVFAYGAFWSEYGTMEWIARRNQLECRWGVKSSTKRKSRIYVDGVIELQKFEDEDDISWDLGFKCPNGWMNQGCLWKSGWSPRCTFQQMHNMALMMSEKTGWPLHQN